MTRCRDLLGSGRYARKSNARVPLTLFVWGPPLFDRARACVGVCVCVSISWAHDPGSARPSVRPFVLLNLVALDSPLPSTSSPISRPPHLACRFLLSLVVSKNPKSLPRHCPRHTAHTTPPPLFFWVLVFGFPPRDNNSPPLTLNNYETLKRRETGWHLEAFWVFFWGGGFHPGDGLIRERVRERASEPVGQLGEIEQTNSPPPPRLVSLG